MLLTSQPSVFTYQSYIQLLRDKKYIFIVLWLRRTVKYCNLFTFQTFSVPLNNYPLTQCVSFGSQISYIKSKNVMRSPDMLLHFLVFSYSGWCKINLKLLSK